MMEPRSVSDFAETRDQEEFLLLTVLADDQGKRLDLFLAEHSELSRSMAQNLIEKGSVTRGGLPLKKKDKVSSGEEISVLLPPPEPIEAEPEPIPLDIRYEDSDVIVINKPKGMVVHPAPGNPSGTLVNALLYHCKEELSGIGGAVRPGIVHRIDKDTGGLLVVAKNDRAHSVLSEALKVHAVKRVYYAVVLGGFRDHAGTVNAPIGRHPTDRKRMAVIRDPEKHSREAITHYRVLHTYRYGGETFSYIECRLETGRTHQIRVHMASIGHPLLGDRIYGGGNTRVEAKHPRLFAGQTLHAGELSFCHPASGEKITVTAPLYQEFEELLSLFRANEGAGE